MASQKTAESERNRQLVQKCKTLFSIAETIIVERKKLYSLYLEWSEISNKTVESILAIRQEILTNNQNSNIASLTGTSTAIVGLLVSFVGVALAIPSAGLSLFLTAGGAATATVGGAVSVGSLITKGILSKQKCEDAKRAFSKIFSLTKSLENQREIYFDLLEEFKNELMEFNGHDFLAAFAEISEMQNVFLKELELDDDVRNSLPPTSIEMEKIKPKEVEWEGILLEILPRLIKLIKKDPLLIKLFKSRFQQILAEGMKNLAPGVDLANIFTKGFAVRGTADVGVAAGAAILKPAESLKDILAGASASFRIGMGILNGVFLVLGVVDLVMTSIEVHNGSTSNESEELLRVANEMKEYREQVIEIMANTFEWEI